LEAIVIFSLSFFALYLLEYNTFPRISNKKIVAYSCTHHLSVTKGGQYSRIATPRADTKTKARQKRKYDKEHVGTRAQPVTAQAKKQIIYGSLPIAGTELISECSVNTKNNLFFVFCG
jgi:hypothetical protein